MNRYRREFSRMWPEACWSPAVRLDSRSGPGGLLPPHAEEQDTLTLGEWNRWLT